MPNLLEDYLKQVESKDTNSIIDALEHLANYADVRAVSAIQNAYFNPYAGVRTAAIYLTASRLDANLFDALLSLLDDQEPDVRQAAVKVLGMYAAKGINENLLIEELIKRQPESLTSHLVKDILIQAGSKVIPILEIELLSFDETRVQRAIEVLPELGDLGIMALVEHIPQLQKSGRIQVAQELGSLNHPMLEDYFCSLIDSEDLEARHFAMAAITNSTVTLKYLEVCGKALLNEPDQQIRMSAAYYLAYSKHPIIRAYFDNYDPSKEKGPYGKSIREFIRRGYRLLDLQKLDLKQLHEILFTSVQIDRLLSVLEIARREDPMSIPFLVRALRFEKSEEIQEHILVALENFEAHEAIDDILNFLRKSSSLYMIRMVYEVLGELGNPKVLPFLQNIAAKSLTTYKSDENSLINTARQVVIKIKQRMDFLKHVWFMQDETGKDQRLYIAMLLATRGDERGLDLLTKNFDKLPHPALRYQTLRALGQCSTLMVLPFFIKQLAKPNQRLVWHVILALGSLPLKKAPPELTALLLDDSPTLRSAVLFALGTIADPQSLPNVLRHLDDTDSQVRALALQTLYDFPYSEDWKPIIEGKIFDEDLWVRLEAARFLKARKVFISPEILPNMIVDAHPEIRSIGLSDAYFCVTESLRPALEKCLTFKDSITTRKAGELLDFLDYEKDPVTFNRKKEQEEKAKQLKEKAAKERRLRRPANKVLKNFY